MARRSDHSRDELYGLALTAAREIAEAEGLASLTARRIAGRIGYSVGTLYNLFDDLDDLILHLNGSTLDLLFEALSRRPPGGAPEADLRALLGAYVDFTQDHRNLLNILLEHRLPVERAPPPWYSEKIGRLLSLLERALEPLFGPGREAETRHSARVLWGAVHGICSLSSAGRLDLLAAEPVAVMTDTLLANYLAGLRAGLAARS